MKISSLRKIFAELNLENVRIPCSSKNLKLENIIQLRFKNERIFLLRHFLVRISINKQIEAINMF